MASGGTALNGQMLPGVSPVPGASWLCPFQASLCSQLLVRTVCSQNHPRGPWAGFGLSLPVAPALGECPWVGRVLLWSCLELNPENQPAPFFGFFFLALLEDQSLELLLFGVWFCVVFAL